MCSNEIGSPGVARATSPSVATVKGEGVNMSKPSLNPLNFKRTLFVV